MRALGATVALLAGLVACGDSGDGQVLGAAEEKTAELSRGVLSLKFAATTGTPVNATGPVGFELRGPFSFEGTGELATVDLTHVRLLGDSTQEMRLVSTGERAYLVVAGEDAVELTAAQAAPLRLGDGNGGVTDLGFAGWVERAVVKEGDGVDTVTGDVNVPDMLSDLTRISAQIAGERIDAVDDDAAAELQRVVRSSDIEVVVGDDHLLRSLHAVVDFGGVVPAALREHLGEYAGARLEAHCLAEAAC